MKNPKTKTKVVHSENNTTWNVIGVSLGKRHKIAVLPYLEVSKSDKEEAFQQAEFISYCFNNSDVICQPNMRDLAEKFYRYGWQDKINEGYDDSDKGFDYYYNKHHFPAASDALKENDDIEGLKRKLEFYRSETAKIRDYVFDDANKCGYPTQSIFEAITDKIDSLRAENEALRGQTWIAVSDRLPEFDTHVIVFCRIHGRYLARFTRIDPEYNWGEWRDFNDKCCFPPTHWMPLPPKT